MGLQGRFERQEEIQERMVSWEPKEAGICRRVASCVRMGQMGWVRCWGWCRDVTGDLSKQVSLKGLRRHWIGVG